MRGTTEYPSRGRLRGRATFECFGRFRQCCRIICVWTILSFIRSPDAKADAFPLPSRSEDAVIGEIRYEQARHADTLLDIARRNDLGYEEIVKANPGINRWIPGEGTRVVVPTMFILPDAPREGIVLNLAELRLYYFPEPEHTVSGAGSSSGVTVYTYPVSVGRMDWKSPLGPTTIVKKEQDPPWRPTESIRAEYASHGEELPESVPGGAPNNPLGRYALRLGKSGYLIHGAEERKEFGIGMRVTHGCIRMYPEDIEKLYAQVRVTTPVLIVDQPVKIGAREGDFYIEIHSALDEDEQSSFNLYSHAASVEEAKEVIARRASGTVFADLRAIEEALRVGDGIPTKIARAASRDETYFPSP